MRTVGCCSRSRESPARPCSSMFKSPPVIVRRTRNFATFAMSAAAFSSVRSIASLSAPVRMDSESPSARADSARRSTCSFRWSASTPPPRRHAVSVSNSPTPCCNPASKAETTAVSRSTNSPFKKTVGMRERMRPTPKALHSASARPRRAVVSSPQKRAPGSLSTPGFSSPPLRTAMVERTHGKSNPGRAPLLVRGASPPSRPGPIPSPGPSSVARRSSSPSSPRRPSSRAIKQLEPRTSWCSRPGLDFPLNPSSRPKPSPLSSRGFPEKKPLSLRKRFLGVFTVLTRLLDIDAISA
jgi:hypothetical protein